MAQEYPPIDISRSTPSLAELVEEVERTRHSRVIRREDAPVALITPIQIRPGDPRAKERFFQVVDRLQERNRDVDPDEVYRDITEAAEEVRQEEYDKRRRPTS